MREMKILKKLDHKNIVKLKEVVTSKRKSLFESNLRIASRENKNRGSVYLVFEFIDHDLHGILDRKIKYNKSEVKCLMKQLLEGVVFMHD